MILPVTFGRGIPLSTQSSSMHVIYIWHSKATTSSISKASPFELLRVIFLLKICGFVLEFETVFPLFDLKNPNFWFYYLNCKKKLQFNYNFSSFSKTLLFSINIVIVKNWFLMWWCWWIAISEQSTQYLQFSSKGVFRFGI